MRNYKLIRLTAILLVMIMYASTAEAGVIAWYPLHGDASAIVGNDGTLVNGPTPAPDENGTANGALSFQADPNNSSGYSGSNTGSYVSVAGGAGLAGLQQGKEQAVIGFKVVEGKGRAPGEGRDLPFKLRPMLGGHGLVPVLPGPAHALYIEDVEKGIARHWVVGANRDHAAVRHAAGCESVPW